jgi:E3 ubiquitin-protein ligase MARCH6
MVSKSDRNSNSITTVPFDLLFFSIAIGPTLSALRFGNRGRRWMRRWWDATAYAFNLTAMLTDHDRTTKIEHPAVLRAWRVLDFFAQIALGKYDTHETWARVPAADSVVLLKPEVRKGRGVFVRLDNQGRTLTPDGSLLMLQQNQAATKANRDPHKDYKRVWLPRYWRTRVHAVVYTALALSGTVVATALFAPLVVGRLILDRAFGHPVHDGYNWVCCASSVQV